MSCNSPINPKWKFAIENNVCPCCGKQIMEEELKNLLSQLSNVINSLSEKFSNQIDAWMLDNFNYIKTTSPRIVDFLPKDYKRQADLPQQVIAAESSNENINNENQDGSVLVKKQSDEETSKFFRNAEVNGAITKASELKRLVSQIKNENPEMARHVAQQDDSDDFEKDVDDAWGIDEDIPASVLAFANQASSKQNNDGAFNQKDAARLQQLQRKTSAARNTILSGGGGKNGFSRSG